ncbi:MAG: agmatine deiminase family protein [Solirubrobacterales bacterium]
MATPMPRGRSPNCRLATGRSERCRRSPWTISSSADAAATTVLQSLFPGRVVELLNIDTLIGKGDGAVHCVTMEEPLP